jgi:hypothetical protein
VLGFTLPALGLGCGPSEAQFDKAALYTPESLAQELAFRYNALRPEAKKSTRKMTSAATSAKRTAELQRARSNEKLKGGNTATTKYRSPQVGEHC